MKNSCLLIAFLCIMYTAKAQCYWNGTMAPNGNQITQQSGNLNLDQAVSLEAQNISNIFLVNPSIHYFDDSGSPNAFSSPTIIFPNFPDGHIEIGFGLVQAECPNLFFNCNALPIIMAHEYAHSYSYKNNIHFASPKKNELYADYLAGAYLYARNIQFGGTINAQVVATGFYNKGDFSFYSYTHHGTPQERLSALMNGYNFVMSRLNMGINSPIYIVSNSAINYLSTIP